MKIQKTKSGQYFITIPKNIIKSMGVRKSDIAEIIIDGPKSIKIIFKEGD